MVSQAKHEAVLEDVYEAAYRIAHYGYREDWMEDLLLSIERHLPPGRAEELREQVAKEE